MAQNLRFNTQIRISPVRVIDQNNDQVGVVPTGEALRMAEEAGLDLVEVAPQDRPPVCRIMDYGKWKYDQKKKSKQHHGSEQQIKEVRLRPKTDTHDLQIKLERAREFLGKGHRVQFTMIFRGRERFHQNMGHQTLMGITETLQDVVKVERPPRQEGRRMTMLLAPLATTPAKPAKPKPARTGVSGKQTPESPSEPGSHAVPEGSAGAVPEVAAGVVPEVAPEAAAPVATPEAVPATPEVASDAASDEPPVAPADQAPAT